MGTLMLAPHLHLRTVQQAERLYLGKPFSGVPVSPNTLLNARPINVCICFA
jgi:hypothetical protein